MAQEIRILIADDHDVVREGLRALIRSEPGMTLVGEAENGSQAIELTRALQPDVLLLDMIMPGMNGLDVIEAIKGKVSPVRILVLTSFSDDELVFPAIKSGAGGYLLKNTHPSVLLQSIRDVHAGMASMSPSIAAILMRELQRPAELPPTEEPLTDREVDILRLIARGLSNDEIAEKLFISEGTVRTHVSRILSKLHLANRTQAALYALRGGLASL
jgi:two-component system, NarL family, response regulator LiaR